MAKVRKKRSKAGKKQRESMSFKGLIAPITASLVGEENAIKKLEKTVSEIGLEEAIKAIAPLKRIVVKGKKLELWLDKPRCNPVIIKRSGSLVIELI